MSWPKVLAQGLEATLQHGGYAAESVGDVRNAKVAGDIGKDALDVAGAPTTVKVGLDCTEWRPLAELTGLS